MSAPSTCVMPLQSSPPADVVVSLVDASRAAASVRVLGAANEAPRNRSLSRSAITTDEPYEDLYGGRARPRVPRARRHECSPRKPLVWVHGQARWAALAAAPPSSCYDATRCPRASAVTFRLGHRAGGGALSDLSL